MTCSVEGHRMVGPHSSKNSPNLHLPMAESGPKMTSLVLSWTLSLSSRPGR